MSFVQTRGSIPVYWMQTQNLIYKPLPDVTDLKDHKTACRKHFENQILLYGKQVIVNLIGQTGPEEPLEKAYANIIKQIESTNIHYEGFDFHTECKNMNYKKLDVLMERLSHSQDEFNVFLSSNCGEIISLQSGVFRTNCTECLDRTNVVQFLLAKRSLLKTLRKFKILTSIETIENHKDFEITYRHTWVQHADILSIQYSGTGALKTDFTRTGKRTRLGYVVDFWYYMLRYVKNNYTDNYNQMAIEIFLGKNLSNSNNLLSVPKKFDIAKFWTIIKYPLIFSSLFIYFLITSLKNLKVTSKLPLQNVLIKDLAFNR